MGFFNFKFNFGGHVKHNDEPMSRHHNLRSGLHHDLNPNHHEHEMVREGRGVFAWIEKSGMFYSGDIPGVNGIMHVNMADSFEECLDKLTDNINDSISASFSSFRQDISYEEIMDEHPDARIVFIPIYKK